MHYECEGGHNRRVCSRKGVLVDMPDRPNILFILTDQLRPDMLGKYARNINALAKRGVRFENCYCASPLCQPSRASIVTGRFPTQHGICGNMSEPITAEERQDTFMQHLKRAGYHCALIGKHHYYDRYNMNMDVTEDDDAIKEYGFDYVWQVVDDGENLHNEDRFTKHLAETGRLEEYRELQRSRAGQCGEYPYPATDSVDGYIGEMAVQYIKDYCEDSPLYLNVGFVGPHPPYWVPKEFDIHSQDGVPLPKKVNDPALLERAKLVRAKYKGKISLIDRYVGQLCDALAAKGMLDNTFIVFTADHGDNLGDYGIIDKRFFFEQSAKVPLIIAGPGVKLDYRVPGAVCKALVSGVDLYPTMLEAAGLCAGASSTDATWAEAPCSEHSCSEASSAAAGYAANARASSIADSLRSRTESLSLLAVVGGNVPLRSEVYSELGTSMMVRDANWKLVYDAEQGGVQYLFNLRRDPDELDNLAGAAGYEHIEAVYVDKLLSRLIRLTHYTHAKEQQRVQRVRV